MRAKAVFCRASAPLANTANNGGRSARPTVDLYEIVMSGSSVDSRFIVALHVQAVQRERHGFLRFFRQREMVLDGERILLVILVRAFPDLPTAGDVFDNDQLGGRFFEVFDLDLVL